MFKANSSGLCSGFKAFVPYSEVHNTHRHVGEIVGNPSYICHAPMIIFVSFALVGSLLNAHYFQSTKTYYVDL